MAHGLGIGQIRFLPVDNLHRSVQSRLRLTLEEIREYNREIAPAILEQALE